MKDIKFRAWHVSNKVMVNFDNEKLCKDVYQREFLAHLLNDCFGDVLMQFTGLVDSEGVDIYEGDILENQIDPVLLNWKVCHNGYCFCIKNNEMGMMYPVDDPLFFIDRKIIGNIHENPELLN